MKNLLNSMLENTMEGTLKHEVVEIITYNDTETFFDRHSNEIFELVEEAKEEGIINLNEFILCKNDLAWFAFETIAQEIYQKLACALGF